MPKYLVKRDTWISHEGRLAREGDVVDINWPKGAEPKTLGSNLEPVKGGEAGKPAKAGKPADGGADEAQGEQSLA